MSPAVDRELKHLVIYEVFAFMCI